MRWIAYGNCSPISYDRVSQESRQRACFLCSSAGVFSPSATKLLSTIPALLDLVMHKEHGYPFSVETYTTYPHVMTSLITCLAFVYFLIYVLASWYDQLSIDFPCSLGEIWMIKSGSIWVCLLNYHQIWHDLVITRWSPRSTYLSSILACRGWFVAVRSMLLIWRLTLTSSQALVDSSWSISCWFLWWDTLCLDSIMSIN
jgi:hypothetical protein